MASRKCRAGPSQPQGGDSTWDSFRFASDTAWLRYHDNIHLQNILPKKNVELAPTIYDEFYRKL